MIGLEDRRTLSRDIDIAHQAGARLHLACEVAGIDVRTLQRWKAGDGLQAGDGRPEAEGGRDLPLAGGPRRIAVEVVQEIGHVARADADVKGAADGPEYALERCLLAIASCRRPA